MAATTNSKEQTTLLRWRDKDTRSGITKKTASLAADQLGMNETQLIHAALAQYIAHTLPQYQTDFDELTPRDIKEIKRRVPQQAKGRVLSSIID